MSRFLLMSQYDPPTEPEPDGLGCWILAFVLLAALYAVGAFDMVNWGELWSILLSH